MIELREESQSQSQADLLLAGTRTSSNMTCLVGCTRQLQQSEWIFSKCSESVRGQMGKWVIEWVSKRVIVWMSEWASDWVRTVKRNSIKIEKGIFDAINNDQIIYSATASESVFRMRTGSQLHFWFKLSQFDLSVWRVEYLAHAPELVLIGTETKSGRVLRDYQTRDTW